MKTSLAFIVSVGLLNSACSSGAGPAGIGALIGKKTLSAAEPLFGSDSDVCFRQTGFMLRLLQAPVSSPPSTTGATKQTRCERIIFDIQTALRATPMPSAQSLRPNSQKSNAAPASTAPLISATQQRRNEVIDAMLAESNRKCGEYTAFLKSYDGGVNSSLSVLSLLTGGLGSFVGGVQTAKALSGTSAIISGTRSSLNEIHFTNQTIHVLASAYEKSRRDMRREIRNRQMCPTEIYTVTGGIEDVVEYHNQCSIVTGLAEAARAVGRSENPGAEAMRNTLAEMTSLRRQAYAFVEEGVVARQSDIASARDEAVTKGLEAADKIARDALTAASNRRKSAADALEAELARDGTTAAGQKPFQDAFDVAQSNYQAAEQSAIDAQNNLTDHRISLAVRRASVTNAKESETTRDLSQIAHCPFTPDKRTAN